MASPHFTHGEGGGGRVYSHDLCWDQHFINTGDIKLEFDKNGTKQAAQISADTEDVNLGEEVIENWDLRCNVKAGTRPYLEGNIVAYKEIIKGEDGSKLYF